MKRNSAFRLLAIDISNSFTKIALFSGTRIQKKWILPTPALTAEGLQKKMRATGFEAVIISSVVPKVGKRIESAFSVPVHHVTHRSPLGIGIDYPRPATIGADRLCNAAACAELYGAPAIVVDFGTAVTFDVISVHRKYVGGVIAPGLHAMTDYLHERTALLPRIRLKEPRSALGKSTVEAMRVGAVIGYRGLIRGILAELRHCEEFGKRRPVLVATGGDAAVLTDSMKEFSAVDGNLTLRGLERIAQLIFHNNIEGRQK